MARPHYLRIAPATSLSLALLSASSCGYYDTTRQRFLDAGGISSSGNKTDDEEEATKNDESQGAPPAADGGTAPTSDSYPGSVVPPECDAKHVPSLKGRTFEAVGAANAPEDDCSGDDVSGRIECAAALTFVGKRSVEIEYTAAKSADDAASDTGRAARHRWNGCYAAVEIYIEKQVGVLEAHAFTLSEDQKKLSHVATGRTFTLVE